MTDSYKRFAQHVKNRTVTRQPAKFKTPQEQSENAVYTESSATDRINSHNYYSKSYLATTPEIDFSFILDNSEEAKKRRARLLIEANILDENGCYVERFFSEETLKNDKNRHKRT